MIIACDVDNVLNNLTESVLKVYNADHNDNLKIEDIKFYGIEEYVKPEFKKDFPFLFLDKRVWKGISVISGCVEVLKKWHDNNHEIYFVTATNTENMHKKAEWLQRTFPFMDVRKNLICMQKKQMLSGNIDVLIDDCINNLDNGKYHSIVFDYPWNQDEYRVPDSPFNYRFLSHRAYNWEDVDRQLQITNDYMSNPALQNKFP